MQNVGLYFHARLPRSVVTIVTTPLQVYKTGDVVEKLCIIDEYIHLLYKDFCIGFVEMNKL